ncbi:hypothetical protein Syun_018670 [Stephania yunnanensis]|uniref:SWIM-type domain-containing protein n=1 Tax=Stephania yunnanensis TaxID=152371 RepID=A0AAP0IU78_9MAGN
MRYGWMNSNGVECFNGVLKGARFLPITALTQMIYYRLVTYHDQRNQEINEAVSKGQPYTEYVMGALTKNVKSARRHHVTLINLDIGEFEVQTGRNGDRMHKGNNTQVVILKDRVCSCNKWQSFGFPCSHVLAACAFIRLSYAQFIEPYYRIYVYAQCHSYKFKAIPDEKYWSTFGTKIIPDPRCRRGQGRPKGSRRHTEMDLPNVQRPMQCGICHQEGHIRTTCLNKDRQRVPTRKNWCGICRSDGHNKKNCPTKPQPSNENL